ncbi:transcriptional elongation regulator MINIYO [Aristolochia californica]|uniref:transcriptional elongation regulator MINIYO n=1 Tax=Aristolochia californica TaxID=171875 RepID=UPI0035DACD65
MGREGVRTYSSSSQKPQFGGAEKNDEPPNLVGMIVEKGFSTGKPLQSVGASTPPRPTVLPFPFARHRSHGPHWAPVGSQVGEEDDDVEDNDVTDFVPIAAFANPVQRKKKKGMNFSKWREFVPSDSIPVRQEKKSSLVTFESNERKGECALSDIGEKVKTDKSSKSPKALSLTHHGSLVKSNVLSNESGEITSMCSTTGVSDSFSDKKQDQLDPLYVRDDCITHPIASPIKVEESGQPNLPFMNDIDAENQSLLANMSPEEIAEAQTEIMEKMQPGLVEMLKKRGRNKLEKLKKAKPDVTTRELPCTKHDENHSHENVDAGPPRGSSPWKENITTPNGHGSSNVVDMKNTEKKSLEANGNGSHATAGSDGSSWKEWTNRVEAIRTLRFSLDGTLVETDSTEMPITGNNVQNVAERDFLRTEGDPGGAGYTIKEAVALIRSLIPGQRAFALQLLASVLDKALCNLQQNSFGCKANNVTHAEESVDWQAVWAFALGPEPGLTLSLRMALDDNHINVVLASLKVIQCILSCNVNESYFNITEKLPTYSVGVYMAPVFRSRPEIDHGFLRGGYWKYSTKLSNIHSLTDDNNEEENEGKATIQNDIVVAGQDICAGLVRMLLLQRLLYLLEMDPPPALEESLLSVLIGVARHSQECADAIMKCTRLVETVAKRVSKKDIEGIYPWMIKSVTLLKVLAQSDEKNCLYFVRHGVFQDVMWHLYKYGFFVDNWMKAGREQYKLKCTLLSEQLSFWKVCIQYGYCISYFSDFFPAMCLWLSPPSSDKLMGCDNFLYEYASVAREAYLTLEALASMLPYLHSEQDKIAGFSEHNAESWSWSHMAPMVESARKWLSLKDNPFLLLLFNQNSEATQSQISSSCCLLWVVSAVLHMLSCVIERLAPSSDESSTTGVRWLPQFVPETGLDIVKNRFLCFHESDCMDHKMLLMNCNSIVEILCKLRHYNDFETSLSSICCLHGVVQLVVSLDKSIQKARLGKGILIPQAHNLSREDKVLEKGIAMYYQSELRCVLMKFMTIIGLEWPDVQSIETFGRGGPAPGVGLGWGASVGGFWSNSTLLAEMDAGLVVGLLRIFPVTFEKGLPAIDDMKFSLHEVSSALSVCLISGPRGKVLVEQAFDFLLQPPVLKYLGFCIHHFLCLKGTKSFVWDYGEEDYLLCSKILNSHFRSRWLRVKKKASDKSYNGSTDSERDTGRRKFKKGEILDTIHEEVVLSEKTDEYPHSTSLMKEWAKQRLPLPVHWFLSAICTTGVDKVAHTHLGSSDDILTTAKAGLFFLLGLESVSSLLNSGLSPVSSVSLVWKLHALSMVLLVKTEVLEDEKERDIYETLQQLYAEHLDHSMRRSKETRKHEGVELLRFKADVHESYTTFLEVFVEQFSAVSYGDLIYGRQIATYLHQCVEASVRLAVWSALSNSHVLDLLPPLEKCFIDALGYLDPVEDNADILEAYVKAWISGALDRAFSRGSISFILVLHHLSSFIFHNKAEDRLSLRKKLARSLLRDYSSKEQHKGMFLKFIHYEPQISTEPEQMADSSPPIDEIERRFNFLTEACEGNSSLLIQVEKLKSNK